MKLQVTDLRIGNLIWLGDGETKVDINTLRDFDVVGSLHDPIPLTEEWLLKFGFKFWGGEGMMLSNGRGQYVFSNITFYRLDSGLLIFLSNMDHVHQLQNLYFSLTGEELTTEE